MRAHSCIVPISIALALCVAPACSKDEPPARPVPARVPAKTPGTTTLDIPDPLEGVAQHAASADTAPNRDTQQIYRLLRRNLALVNACFLRAKRRSPHIAGRMTVSMVVGPGPKGMVRKAKIAQRSFSDRRMETCVVGSLRAFSFPRQGKADLTLRVPLIFR
jgi:hypothetical protein